jgi:hypothetical protein
MPSGGLRLTGAWPYSLSPQQRIVPSFTSAQVWERPLLAAVNSEAVAAGAVVMPNGLKLLVFPEAEPDLITEVAALSDCGTKMA